MLEYIVSCPTCWNIQYFCCFYCFFQLPPKLGVLKNLCKLDLEMCPIDGMVQDLLQHSTHPVRDIQGFLLSVLEESVVLCYAIFI